MNIKKVLLIVGVIAVIGNLGFNYYKKSTPLVKVKEIKLGNLVDESGYIGTIIPEEVEAIHMKSQGIIEEVIVNIGEEVKIGNELLKFSKESVVEIEKQLELNQLDLENQKLKIHNLENGKSILDLNNKKIEIEALRNEIEKDEKNLPLLAREAKAYEILLEKNGVSSIEANRKIVAYEDLQTKLELNREKYSLMDTSYEVLKQELEIAKENLKLGLTRLEFQRKELIEIEEQLKYPLLSPVNGVVMYIAGKAGSIMGKNQMIIGIATDKNNKVKLEVPIYLGEIFEKGQNARIISRENSQNKEYMGVVDKVSTIATEEVGRKGKFLELEVKILDKNDLKIGYIVDVNIQGKTKEDVLLVDNFSVLEEDERYYVYLAEEEKAIKKEVSVGAKTISSYEVLDLELGSKIIVNPFKVKDGQKIRIAD